MRLFEEYRQNLINNKQLYLKDYDVVLKKMNDSPAKYKGKPIDFLYQPFFLSQKDIKNFEDLLDVLNGILNKVTLEYLRNKEFRKNFGFSDLLEKLILKDPGYNYNFPIGRFDIFYHLNGNFQFCELNTDGSSAMTEVRELQNAFENAQFVKDLSLEGHLKGFELFNSWVDSLTSNYHEFSNSKEMPNVAIVDWIDKEPPSEFIEFKKVFEKKGINTVIADPRELVYKNNKLYFKDFRIDCIYRRLVTFEIIERADEIKDFINAYLNGDVCVVGSLRSQIPHNKKIFSILHNEKETSFLNEFERAFIEKHIPYTVEFDINNSDLIEKAKKNKDLFVLKPVDKYASYGVKIGKDFTQNEWDDFINNLKDDYLLQELCSIPKIDMAMFKNNEFVFEKNNYIIGLFVYNEKLNGVYVRTGRKNIIGSVAECFTIPAFIVE